MPEPARHVIVFARVPTLGAVKTRLAATIGPVAALEAYRTLGRCALDAVRASRASGVTVAYTPASTDAKSELLAWLGEGGGVEFEPQCEGDLGQRMQGAIAERLANQEGKACVVVVGTDCPWLTAAHIDQAFETLAARDVVLGPAADGGYYLIGMSKLQPVLFADVPWSSADTLAVTLRHARNAGLSVSLLEELRDVDDDAGWRAWIAGRPPVPRVAQSNQR